MIYYQGVITMLFTHIYTMNSNIRFLFLILLLALQLSLGSCSPGRLDSAHVDQEINVDQVIGDNLEKPISGGDNLPLIDRSSVSNLTLIDSRSVPGAEMFVWINKGNHLAIGSSSEINIYGSTSIDAKPVRTIPVEGLIDLTVSGDGDSLLWVDRNNSVYLFDVTELGKETQPISLITESATVIALAISDDGSHVAISSSGSGIRILSSSDYQAQHLIPTNDMVFDLKFSPDSENLFGVERSTFLARIWDINSNGLKKIFSWEESVSSELTAVSISPNWNQIGWIAAEVVQLMGTQNGELGEMLLHEDSVGAFTWSEPGDLITTSGIEESRGEYLPTAYFWDPLSGKLLNKIFLGGPITQIQYSFSGDRLGILTSDGQISFWSVQDGE